MSPEAQHRYKIYTQMMPGSVMRLDTIHPVPKSPIGFDEILTTMGSHGFNNLKQFVSRLGLDSQDWLMIDPDPNCMPFTLLMGKHGGDVQTIGEASSTILTRTNVNGVLQVQFASALLDLTGNWRVVTAHYDGLDGLQGADISVSKNDLPIPTNLADLSQYAFQTLDLSQNDSYVLNAAGVITPRMMIKTGDPQHPHAVRFVRKNATTMELISYGIIDTSTPVEEAGFQCADPDNSDNFTFSQRGVWSLSLPSSLSVNTHST